MTLRKQPIDIRLVVGLPLIAVWILALATAIASPQGWITKPNGRPSNGDYIGIYAAGELARSGQAPAVYDLDRHRAAQRRLDANPKGSFYPWPYPPTFLLVATVLALLPYFASMLTWVLATFAVFVAAIARISTSWQNTLLMLATPAPWFNLYIGQNGALTAGLMGFGLVLLETQPVAAGIAIGLLSFKPHLGLLIPVALFAGGYYRAFAAAAATVVAIVAVSIVAFGTAPWLALPHQLAHVASIIGTAAETEKVVSLFGLARGLGLPAENALWLQCCLTASLFVLIGWLWSRRGVAFALKAAALAAAATLATPYQFAYDLVILTVAQAFLLSHLWKKGMDRIDAYALILANGFVMMFSYVPTIPLAVFGCAMVLGLTLRHVVKEAAPGGRDFSPAEKMTAACLPPDLPLGKT
jgi:hypothetical protein